MAFPSQIGHRMVLQLERAKEGEPRLHINFILYMYEFKVLGPTISFTLEIGGLLSYDDNGSLKWLNVNNLEKPDDEDEWDF